MADMKANMMLTVASLVIPLSVGHLHDERLRLGAIIAIIFCLITIILAAYATMPKLRPPNKNDESPDLKNPFFNILFFGDFSRLSYEQFSMEMSSVLNEPDRPYEAMLREIYSLGCYLALKKYRFVRLAYISFITGLVLSGCALAWTNLVAVEH